MGPVPQQAFLVALAAVAAGAAMVDTCWLLIATSLGSGHRCGACRP